MFRDAVISECGDYRYQLTRTWDRGLPWIMYVGLNPSVADAHRDDNTIRRLIKLSTEWGYGGLLMANLFAYRATNHTEMYTVADPVGPETDSWLARQAALAAEVVACWGVFGQYRGRAATVIESGILGDYKVLGLTKDGHPAHPLIRKRLAADRPVDPRIAEALAL